MTRTNAANNKTNKTVNRMSSKVYCVDIMVGDEETSRYSKDD